jgi:tryptophanyl-tRNA synthetase
VGEHAELAWILSCLTSFGELQRMTQFKDKANRKGTTTLGLFAYPVLQAADILLYQADQVPVGEDQKQHLELTRDLASRFNARFGPAFKIPQPAIAPAGARIMDLQDPRKKMSKSGASPDGAIWLTDTPDSIRKKIRSAVTDSGSEVKGSSKKPALSNLLVIYSIIANKTVEEAEQEFAGTGYAHFKNALAELLIAYLQPIQNRFRDVASERGEIVRVLYTGAERARAVASHTLNTVKQSIGLLSR